MSAGTATETCGRLDLVGGRQPVGLPGQITESSAEGKVKGALTGARKALSDTLEDIVNLDGRD